MIVGQTTFGKGSVQLVFPHVTPENAALKLTIAQYLTPGDVSIQGVGVAPDIELDPMTADTVEMDLYRNAHGLRERDLTKSLSNTAHRASDQPSMRLRYNLPEKERAAKFATAAGIWKTSSSSTSRSRSRVTWPVAPRRASAWIRCMRPRTSWTSCSKPRWTRWRPIWASSASTGPGPPQGLREPAQVE